MRWAAEHDGPVFLRLGREKAPSVTDEKTPFVFGKAQRLREGDHGTILANGVMVAPVLLAAERLAREEGLEVRVLNVHTVKPLDVEAVLQAARETPFLVTVEEGSTTGGLGAAVAGVVVQSGAPVPMRILGAPDAHLGSGDPWALVEKAKLSDLDVAAAVRELAASARGHAALR